MTDQNKKPFTSLLEACDHLKAEGYKVSKSKIYRDADEGKITRETDGTITAEAARHYAKMYLVKEGTAFTKKELKNLQAKKLKNTIRNQDQEYKRKAWEFERDQGQYVPRGDFEAELAGRAVVFDSMFRHLFNTRVQDWISLVDGNKAKAADLLAALNESLDALLNEYATTKSFQVLFEDGPDDDEGDMS